LTGILAGRDLKWRNSRRRRTKQKLILLRRYRFNITAKKVKQTVQNPVKIDERNDGTLIATTLFDEKHILRVVYRQEDDIMIVITMYPGRRKAYGF